MSVRIELPADIEENLRNQVGDLDQVAKEALAVELYRQRRITHFQLSNLLGLDRFQTDGVLQQHGVYDDLTFEDVRRQADSLRDGRSSC